MKPPGGPRLMSLLLAAWFIGSCGSPPSAESASPPYTAASNRFGVIIGGGRGPDTVSYVRDLGAAWVRLNAHLDGTDPDFAMFLDAGANLVITFNNADPSNIDTSYGTPAQWSNAGFPFRSKLAYQQRIRESLAPVLPYLDLGRQVWVQCENEVSDAAVNPQARYWRGTTDQYLTQLQALYEVVRSISPSIPVVLTSFPSESLGVVLDPADPRHAYESTRLNTLLTVGPYDSADLHFYGCVEDIPAKAQWVKDHLPAGKRWISTENGGPDSRCPTTPMSWTQNPTLFEQLQAQQVPARLTACAENGGLVCLWFSLFDLVHETSVFSHLGLLDTSDTPLRKKPAYDSFRSYTAIYATLSLPPGQATYSYAPPIGPVVESDPAPAKPLALGNLGSGVLSPRVAFLPVAGPADIYLAYTLSTDPSNVLAVKPDLALQPFTIAEVWQAFSSGVLPPWLANTAGPIDTNPGGDLPLASMGRGTYTLYLLMTPAGNRSQYYLWMTSFTNP